MGVSCSKKQAAQAAATPATTGNAAAAPAAAQTRVAFVARTQNDTFCSWLAQAMREDAKNANIKLDIYDGQDSDDKINSFLETAIANKYDIIVLQAQNTIAQGPAAYEVIKAGIPFIDVNLRIPTVKLGDGTVVDMTKVSNSVDAVPYDQGKVNADYAFTLIPQNAQVVVLDGPADHPHSIARRKAWQEHFFAKRPDVKILAEQYADWKKDKAMQYMEDWITAYHKIDAVISMNDMMATGAIEAAKNHPELKGMYVFGVDGTAQAALYIKDGSMTSTSFQNAYQLSTEVFKIIKGIKDGTCGTKNSKEGFVNEYIDCPLVTKDGTPGGMKVDDLIAIHKRSGALK
jgi:inositol transport system substrate-binding protein